MLLVAVGDSSDHSGRPGQGRGAAGSQRSHEEPEDPPGAPDVFSGQQEQTLHTDLNPEFHTWRLPEERKHSKPNKYIIESLFEDHLGIKL